MTAIDSTWATTGELRGETIARREGSRIVEEAKQEAGRIVAAADEVRDAAGQLFRAANLDRAAATAALAEAERQAAGILADARRQADTLLEDAQLARAMASIGAPALATPAPVPPAAGPHNATRARRGIGALMPDASEA